MLRVTFRLKYERRSMYSATVVNVSKYSLRLSGFVLQDTEVCVLVMLIFLLDETLFIVNYIIFEYVGYVASLR